MIEPDYKHVLFKDLCGYLKKSDYLEGFTPAELKLIRLNIGAAADDKAPLNVQYSKLSSLLERSKLIPGAVYAINDFLTIYRVNGQIKFSPTFTIVCIAATENKLFPNALMITNDENSIYWTAYYDSTKETLEDGTVTKGKITYLRDQNFNLACFDFKHIQISRNGKLYYTFDDGNGNENSINCFNNNLIFGRNNIFIGEQRNNTIHGDNNYICVPVSNLYGEVQGLTIDMLLLNDNTPKSIIKYNDTYYIDYLDLETLTHLFYALSLDSNISE